MRNGLIIKYFTLKRTFKQTLLIVCIRKMKSKKTFSTVMFLKEFEMSQFEFAASGSSQRALLF